LVSDLPINPVFLPRKQVWRYEGSNTLASYLNRRDGLDALAADLGVAPSDVIQTATGQILSALAELHAAGLVHRDLKPANIILAEAERRLKLIDLGGCAGEGSVVCRTARQQAPTARNGWQVVAGALRTGCCA
jgi:serine/threonine protein kinase